MLVVAGTGMTQVMMCDMDLRSDRKNQGSGTRIKAEEKLQKHEKA